MEIMVRQEICHAVLMGSVASIELHGICHYVFRSDAASEVCEGPERTRTTMRTTYDVTVDTTVDRGVPIGTITHESQVTVGTN